MRVTYIHKEPASEIVMAEAQRRLMKAANILKDNVRSNLKAVIKNPNYSRPVYKTGKYAGKWWTARDANELLNSVRIVQKNTDIERGHRNIWIMCGHSKAYWAAMFEFATDPKRGKKFFRPAIASSRPKMKSVLENG